MIRWWLILSALCCTQAVASGWVIDGRAEDIKTGQLLYTEHYNVSVDRQGKPLRANVEYRQPGGQPFAWKTIDYQSGLLTPAIDMHDKRDDYHVTVVRKGDTLVIDHQQHQRNSSEQVTSDGTDTVVVDAGFDMLVQQHWDSLLAGNQVKFRFLSIDRGSLVNFTLLKVSEDDHRVYFEIRPRSFFVRLLVDAIKLEYGKDDHHLYQFSGLTNLQKMTHGKLTGDNYVARITYQYRSVTED